MLTWIKKVFLVLGCLLAFLGAVLVAAGANGVSTLDYNAVTFTKFHWRVDGNTIQGPLTDAQLLAEYIGCDSRDRHAFRNGSSPEDVSQTVGNLLTRSCHAGRAPQDLTLGAASGLTILTSLLLPIFAYKSSAAGLVATSGIAGAATALMIGAGAFFAGLGSTAVRFLDCHPLFKKDIVTLVSSGFVCLRSINGNDVDEVAAGWLKQGAMGAAGFTLAFVGLALCFVALPLYFSAITAAGDDAPLREPLIGAASASATPSPAPSPKLGSKKERKAAADAEAAASFYEPGV